MSSRSRASVGARSPAGRSGAAHLTEDLFAPGYVEGVPVAPSFTEAPSVGASLVEEPSDSAYLTEAPSFAAHPTTALPLMSETAYPDIEDL